MPMQKRQGSRRSLAFLTKGLGDVQIIDLTECSQQKKNQLVPAVPDHA